MLLETGYEHVMLNDARVPIISGTTMKVIELISRTLHTVGARTSYIFSSPIFHWVRSIRRLDIIGIIVKNWIKRLKNNWNRSPRCAALPAFPPWRCV